MNDKLRKITVHFLPHTGRDSVTVQGYGQQVGYGIITNYSDDPYAANPADHERQFFPTYKVWEGRITRIYPASVIFMIEADI